MVSLDDSRLFYIIQTCTEYDEIEKASKEQEEIKTGLTSNKECCKNFKQRNSHQRSETIGKVKYVNRLQLKINAGIINQKTKPPTMCQQPKNNCFPANFNVLDLMLF